MSEDSLTIEQLEEVTGVTRRNIRFLISEGVVPEPYGKKRWARYGAKHVSALHIYSKMKDSGVSSLDVIRNKISASASASPPLIINHITGVDIKISQEAIEVIGLEDLIEDIVKSIKNEAIKKGVCNAEK